MRAREFAIGDKVTVGGGEKVWVIERFWAPHGEQLASLSPVGGFSGTTVSVDRLRAARTGDGP